MKHKAGAEGALARDPGPIRYDDISGTAPERDLAGFGTGELSDLNGKSCGPVETMGADDVKFPPEGTGSLGHDANRVVGASRPCEQDDCRGKSDKDTVHVFGQNHA